MYKTLGFKWLCEVFCPASASATPDSDEARNPQRFIHVTVVCHKNATFCSKIASSFQILITVKIILNEKISNFINWCCCHDFLQ